MNNQDIQTIKNSTSTYKQVANLMGTMEKKFLNCPAVLDREELSQRFFRLLRKKFSIVEKIWELNGNKATPIDVFHHILIESCKKLADGNAQLAEVYFGEKRSYEKLKKFISDVNKQGYSEKSDLAVNQCLGHLSGVAISCETNDMMSLEAKKKQYDYKMMQIMEIIEGKSTNQQSLALLGVLIEEVKVELLCKAAKTKQLQKPYKVISESLQNINNDKQLIDSTDVLISHQMSTICKCLVMVANEHMKMSSQRSARHKTYMQNSKQDQEKIQKMIDMLLKGGENKGVAQEIEGSASDISNYSNYM